MPTTAPRCEPATVPLPMTAAALGSYGEAYNKLMAGELVGEKRGGRWFVTESSARSAVEEKLAQEEAKLARRRHAAALIGAGR